MEIGTKRPQLIILLGATGVGKTDLSLRIATHLASPIISADSRQLYRDLPIGTAAPTTEQRATVEHFMVGTLDLEDYYSANQFETDVLSLLDKLYPTHPRILMTGGSMMYLDAVAKGIDDIPTIRPEIREEVFSQYAQVGLAPFLEELRTADPKHYEEVDRKNFKRVLHAIEICRQTGLPYSSFRTNSPKQRPFDALKIGLKRDREELCERINLRVDQMIQDGLIDEARKAYPFRQYNSLNTVGYKELFAYFDGTCTLDFAIEKIKRNSRVYARKQMTWFKRDTDIHWFHPDEETEILRFIDTH